MKKRKRRIIAVLLCWMLCGTTASGAVQEGEVTTTIRSGEVRIRMHRYGDEKKEKGWEDLEHILPGQKITMITEIENLGENCLIRYQMTAEAKSNREIPISSFSGIPGNCVRKGEYFYHTDVVKHRETVRLFTAFTLPETWEQGGEDEIRIHVAADAIQSRNFTPDFTSEHPWGDQVIQKVSGKTGDQLRILTPRKGTCRVVLEGDDIITVPDTFFAEFGTLVPGDVIQGELQIDNRSGRKMYTGSWRQRKNFFWNRRNFGWKRKMVRFSAKEVLRNNPWGNLLSLKRMNKMRKKISYSFSVFRKTWIIHTVCGSPHLPGRFGQCQRILRFRQDRSRSKPGRTVM